jgi:hypothetical protein
VREWVGGYPVELCVVVATPPHHGKAVRRGEELRCVIPVELPSRRTNNAVRDYIILVSLTENPIRL